MIVLFRIFLLVILALCAFIWLPRMIFFGLSCKDGSEVKSMKYILTKMATETFVICDIVYIIMIYTIITNFMI